MSSLAITWTLGSHGWAVVKWLMITARQRPSPPTSLTRPRSSSTPLPGSSSVTRKRAPSWRPMRPSGASHSPEPNSKFCERQCGPTRAVRGRSTVAHDDYQAYGPTAPDQQKAEGSLLGWAGAAWRCRLPVSGLRVIGVRFGWRLASSAARVPSAYSGRRCEAGGQVEEERGARLRRVPASGEGEFDGVGHVGRSYGLGLAAEPVARVRMGGGHHEDRSPSVRLLDRERARRPRQRLEVRGPTP